MLLENVLEVYVIYPVFTNFLLNREGKYKDAFTRIFIYAPVTLIKRYILIPSASQN